MTEQRLHNLTGRRGRIRYVALWFALVGFVSAPGGAQAAQLFVAVATNFSEPAKELGAQFERETGHTVRLSFGSTGQLYAQIRQGAPFEVYLAADQARPRQAIADGLAVAGSQFTYATGRLVLFSREADRVAGASSLRAGGFHRLAIANPQTAPYGAAAVATLHALGVYDAVAPRIVQGANIAQAFQFVATGNAELGFVALSQVIQRTDGSRWIVPDSLHPPIAQDAVLLSRGATNPAAGRFLDFLRSAAADGIKARYGYDRGD
ncbi:MAG: molybdate ABC transporter substrate-binding protein [Chromatiales bacterium]|nr:molybdate ABC transporter substrate-binding protein [Chromatiales bacterium]